MNLRRLISTLLPTAGIAVVLACTFASAPAVAISATAALSAAVACLYRAARRCGRMRLVWGAFGLGALSCALAGATAGNPGAGYLIMIAFVGVGMFLVPSAGRTGANRGRRIIDAALVAVSLTILSSYLVVEPSLTETSPIFSYPFADVLIGTLALIGVSWLRRGMPDLTPLTVFGVGLLLIGYGDSATLAGAHQLGGAAWFAGFTTLSVAALLPRRTEADSNDGDLRMVAVLLPYVVVSAGLLVSTAWLSLGNGLSPLGAWAGSLSILLIVVRQVILVLENNGLTAYLESRVTARVADLHASEARFRALIEQSTDSITILDSDLTIRYQSESVERIFGYPAAKLLGRRIPDIIADHASERVLAAVAEVVDAPGANTICEAEIRHADGSLRLAELTVTNLFDDPYVHGLVFNTRDISEAHELQEQLRHEAYHDALTGLHNRAGFRERLAEAFAAHDRDRVAILFLDLDSFKKVNDSLGHEAGDRLLLQVAARLRRCMPEPRTVARLGGDEFAVIVEADHARAVAETVAGEILAALAEPVLMGDRELHVGAAIGIAVAADAVDIEQLQRDADLAMYRAKDAGGGQWATYDASMHDALVRRLELAADLRRALEREEFVLHYQPTVDLVSGTIVGFEALVRWHHPTRGMVPPLDFIGVAESTGLIMPLGRWVLAEACRQAVAWGAATYRPLKMAVNVSARQFEAGDLAETVSSVLADTGMPAELLCLEMTESVLLTDTDENLNRIVGLKALGITLAMDDFGTGYSSLAYLRRFPIDVLKIDRSFVDGLGGESKAEGLVRTIVRLGQRFGMATVAEGIENTDQAAALRTMGCDFGQGYVLSRPLKAADATALLEVGVPALA